MAPETGLVLDVGDVVLLAHRLRFLPPSSWRTMSPDMLRRGARNLRRAAYLLVTLAAELDREAAFE